jgi:signal transduction histidine kinase
MTDPSSFLEVLIIEDSETDAKLVVQELRRNGFSPSWKRVDTASALREALLRGNWRVVISDANVPGLGTLHALAMTKELRPHVPFIVVSGTITEEQAVSAMRQGAADYVTKERLSRLGPAVARELAESLARESPAQRLASIQETERRRIARTLHDQFGQLLTALKLTLDSVAHGRGLARARALAEAQALVAEAMSQARDLSVELWPTVLDDVGLAAALRDLAGRHARWSGAAVSFDGEVGRLPFVVETACFRIAQQALTNVTQHAHARRAHVRVHASSEVVELFISDDGKGFDVASALERAAAAGNLGLIAMQERASLAGGRLTIDSAPNRGTLVSAHFPLAGSGS